MRTAALLLLVGGSLSAGGGLGLCCPPGAAAEAPSRVDGKTAAAAPDTVRLEVPGMFCGACALAVRTSLKRVEGVTEVDIDLKAHRVAVVRDPGLAGAEELIEAVHAAGFRRGVRVVEEADGGG